MRMFEKTFAVVETPPYLAVNIPNVKIIEASGRSTSAKEIHTAVTP